jgi:xanthine dehydrogenase accessory factor
MNIYNDIKEAIEKNEPSWLVTVTNVIGSTPAKIGMKMIVYSDGKIKGTVGGGEIEKRIIDKIVDMKPVDVDKWSYNLGTHNIEAEETNMECGGTQEVIVEPLTTENNLYRIGGGHCGMALSTLTAKTGFFVTVIDNRSDWANKEKHPLAKNIVCPDYKNICDKMTFSENTFIVIMTHGHAHDEYALEQVINEKYKFVGMIGSSRKVSIVFENLMKKGISKDKIRNVYSPVGLDIGATHTPEDIAVSIMAQLIAVKNNKREIKLNLNPLLST